MTAYPHWADVLQLRPEIVDSAGQISDLQMSLYSAVYTNRDVDYQDAARYADITEPTVGLVRFTATVARRLGGIGPAGKALFHLDQGMGGGKSHALVGLYHLANTPETFLPTHLGSLVKAEAEQGGGQLDLGGARVVVLCADNMTPGATSPEFGPASNLYERFLWSLCKGDKDRYNANRAEGPNKAALARALAAAGAPVLILLDELMDYAMLLSDEKYLGSMPGEKAFLNNLMDAVDEVPQVAFVVVMIRSDLDERGYTVEAEDFRSYVATRLERNGITVAVTEAQDFAAIIRRRLFQSTDTLPADRVAAAWQNGADDVWQQQVFSRLGAARGLPGFTDRVRASYPFAPDLMGLVRDDWSRHAGFQRVRSTVEIFAATTYHWIREHAQHRWAPDLVGIGDLPLHVVVEHVLSSGLLHGNERAIQGYRQVAAADVVNKDATQGRARHLDDVLAERSLDAGQPYPAVRMATALFCYSLVPRAQAKRGATKAELLAAVYHPHNMSFHAAEEVFNAIVSDDEGLGALDITDTASSKGQDRYQLSVAQTLRMFFRQARNAVQPADRDAYIWEQAQTLAQKAKGWFDQLVFVTAPPPNTAAPLSQVFGDVDQNSQTRLVILDPRRWNLNNGRDTATRTEVAAMLGVGERALPVDNGASCVVACVNTQRRDALRRRATDMLAWAEVLRQLDPNDEKRNEALQQQKAARDRVDADLLKAYQHLAYLVRTDRVEVVWERFDDDAKTSLKGNHTWDALVGNGRAVLPYTLSGDYLRTLLDKMNRPLTLKEVTQQFYKNAAFPIVPSADDIRRAIFQTLRGTDPYEVVDGHGDVLTIRSADDLSLGSMDLILRKAIPGTPDPAQSGATATSGTRATGGSQPQPGGGQTPEPNAQYRVYRLDLPHRSLVDPDVRRATANLLQALLDQVDPDIGGDIQLFEMDVTLTADHAAVETIAQRATDTGARWTAEDPDF